MSLFTVLKYGNTNFLSLNDLRAVPEDILLELSGQVTGYGFYTTSNPITIRIAYMFCSKSDREEIHKAFRKILENYEEP